MTMSPSDEDQNSIERAFAKLKVRQARRIEPVEVLWNALRRQAEIAPLHAHLVPPCP
jgi:hypothetical protein